MKVCYIILACEKYIPTRCLWQTNTWLRNVIKDENSSYYFLCSTNAKDDIHYLKLNADDSYESCPYKYVEFFKNIDISEYDWIIFCDDDTYMYHNRVKNELSKYDSSQLLLLGEVHQGACQEFKVPTVFGGAGFIISNTLYKKLRDYVISNSNNIYIHRHGDVSMCEWISHIPDVTVVDLVGKLFSQHPHTYDIPNLLHSALSFHYVTEELFNKFIQYDD